MIDLTSMSFKPRAGKNAWWLISSLTLLSACSWFGSEPIEPPSPTLAQMQPSLPAAVEPEVSTSMPVIELAEIVAHYRAALEVADDPEVRRKVQRRLAGLEMLQSEQRQLDATELNQRHYDGAIALYRELLAAHPSQAGNDSLSYQIAKAYELDGRLDDSMRELDRLVATHPDSPHYTEAQFRRGEILFSQRRYAEAEKAYRAAASGDNDTPFYHNAVYMQGWSQFKRNRYRASLRPFTEVLDRLLPEHGDLDALPRSRQEMARDTLRVMGLVFSYLDGGQTIREVYGALGERPYQHLLYQQLGDLYLGKERYRDSADTYKLFVDNYPNHDRAPQFSVKMIEVYGRGNFPSLILPAKQNFARRYGIHSPYWAGKGESVRAALRPHLHTYLGELAKHYHALAQNQKKQRQQALAKKQKTKLSQQQVKDNYLQAGNWYAEFAETFPEDKATPGMVFLMAESLYEGDAFARAIEAYERVAYHYRDGQQGAEAGYSAVLAYDQYLAAHPEMSGAELAQWQLRKIDSSVQFADHYPADKRAVAVLSKAAEQRFGQRDYRTAVELAARVTAWSSTPVDETLLRTGWLLQGHSLFELSNFVDAEAAYQSALGLMGGEQHELVRRQTTERLAATVFKRSEQLLASDATRQAVAELLRIQQLSPNSEIAIKAQYDAAAHLMALNEWQRAEQVLTDFQSRYPQHKLTATIPAKLAQTYQALEDWQRAGDALAMMAKADKKPEVQRQSLFLAAEMYEKAENWSQAIGHYRDYAHGYPEPFDMVTEARFKMSELYVTTNEPQKRRFWLRKMIDGHRAAGASGTDRSKYLAAMSASVFADDEYQKFASRKLKLPLKNSLRKKRQSLEKTLQAYQQVLEIGVQQYATKANFRIGELYRTLSADLMDSERPALGELELEQYEVLLEEQAFPFEEQAIEVHRANAERSWTGLYDQWVKRSFEALASLQPGRYRKPERVIEVSRDVY